jgi:SpoIID/LytB domain protein
MKSKTQESSFIYENPDRHVFQLRLGPYSTKERAQQAVEMIKEKGVPSAFYVAENTGSGKQPELLLKDHLGNLLLRTRQKATVWSEGSSISVDGKGYKGYVVVFVNPTGRLTIVNVLNLEEYLKGVVPNEIPSSSIESLEAIKAQAVAARTYAYKNRNQFESEGYDICATPRCQVYQGADTEKALSTKAIEDTRGEIITYQGEPINALYTSTCGGRTENVEIMFEDWNYPYLRGVECYPEESGSQKSTISIHGKMQPWWLAWLGLKTGKKFSGDLNQTIATEEAVSVTNALLSYLGKTSCSAAAFSNPDWTQTGDYLVQQLCWQKKRDSLLIEKDYQYFLSHLNINSSKSPAMDSFLFLYHDGIMLPEDPARFQPDQPMTRGQFFKTLYNILDHYHQVNPTKGMVRELNDHEIQVVDEMGVHTYSYPETISLYQMMNDQRIPRDQLSCSLGDQVEFYLQREQLEILGCEMNSAGASMDRSSKYSFWQESLTSSQLGEKVSKYLDVGDIVDLEPLSYGPSGRVYEMKITGTKGSGTLKGIRVRWALGLKENLFVMDRTSDSNGRSKTFVFNGRGWGHGVGMCQIGALGYAKMGKDYRSILQHYYTNVQITKVY